MNGYSIKEQSDARLKTNIQDSSVDAVGLINQIEIKEFDWIETQEHECAGMIAQQLQEVIPDLVSAKQSGQLTIKTTKLIPYLIKAIQELTAYVTEGTSTFGVREGWKDPYTQQEKIEFINANLECQSRPLQTSEAAEVQKTIKVKTQLPIKKQGEYNHE
jgi:hypothetical protein